MRTGWLQGLSRRAYTALTSRAAPYQRAAWFSLPPCRRKRRPVRYLQFRAHRMLMELEDRVSQTSPTTLNSTLDDTFAGARKSTRNAFSLSARYFSARPEQRAWRYLLISESPRALREFTPDNDTKTTNLQIIEIPPSIIIPRGMSIYHAPRRFTLREHTISACRRRTQRTS